MRTFITRGTLALVLLTTATTASAQTTSSSTPLQSAITQSLRYPIAELGYCMSKTDCKAYCDLVSHIQPCLVYAQSHNLMTELEAQKALLLATFSGPQGCKGQQCITYCNAPAHYQECSAFANRILTLSGQAPKQGTAATSSPIQRPGIGGCKNPTECGAYCRAHEAACKTVGEKIASSTQNIITPQPATAPTRQKQIQKGSASSSLGAYLGAAALSAFMLLLQL